MVQSTPGISAGRDFNFSLMRAASLSKFCSVMAARSTPNWRMIGVMSSTVLERSYNALLMAVVSMEMRKVKQPVADWSQPV